MVSDLGTLGSLDSDVRGLLRTKLLTVGTDPLLGWSLLVDLVELFLGRSSLVSGFGSGGSEDVSSNDTEVAEKFSEFRVGDKEGDQHSEVSSGCRQY